MSDNRKTSSGLLALLCVAVVLLPMLYLLSIGPAVYFNARGDLPEHFESVYEPIELLADQSETFRVVAESYVRWWEQLAQNDE